MKNLSTQHRVFYAIAGVCLLVYGLKTVLVQGIGTDSAEARGWIFQGDPAVLLGLLSGVAGAYLVYLAFNLRD